MEKADIEKLFELAKIDVSEEELERFPKEISSILAYVKKLSSAPFGDIKPTLSFAPTIPRLREDDSFAQTKDSRAEVIAAFPDAEKGYLKTMKVFD